LLLQATEENQKYGSKAADDGAPSRKAKNILQKVLNKSGWLEVGGQQAAACVLGEKSFVSSHKFTLLFGWDAVKRFMESHDNGTEFDQEISLDDFLETDASGKFVSISQWEKYTSKGEVLKDFNLYDYAGLIESKPIKPVKEKKSASEAGRHSSTRILFTPGSKSSKCFFQIVLSSHSSVCWFGGKSSAVSW